MASRLYNFGIKKLADGTCLWLTDDIRVALVTSSYVPNQDTHEFLSSITNELSGGGYVRKVLAGKAITIDNANDRIGLFADNVVWTALGVAAGTPAMAIVYEHNASDAAAALIGWVEFTTPPTPNGGDWTAKWNNAASNGELFRNSAV
jgi:hypothetical protein